MKIGIRIPSLTKSFKARTTGRLKRSIKGSVNPLYGKKGMGLIKNPKQSIYNTIYHKTTKPLFSFPTKKRKINIKKVEYIINYCTNCGTKIKKNAVFCIECGHIITKK